MLLTCIHIARHNRVIYALCIDTSCSLISLDVQNLVYGIEMQLVKWFLYVCRSVVLPHNTQYSTVSPPLQPSLPHPLLPPLLPQDQGLPGPG